VAAVAVALDAAEDREALLAAPGPLLAPAIAWSAAAVLMPVAGEISARHHEFAAAVRPRPIEEDR